MTLIGNGIGEQIKSVVPQRENGMPMIKVKVQSVRILPPSAEPIRLGLCCGFTFFKTRLGDFTSARLDDLSIRLANHNRTNRISGKYIGWFLLRESGPDHRHIIKKLTSLFTRDGFPQCVTKAGKWHFILCLN
jgi:hypothetical protein